MTTQQSRERERFLRPIRGVDRARMKRLCRHRGPRLARQRRTSSCLLPFIRQEARQLSLARVSASNALTRYRESLVNRRVMGITRV